MPLYEKWPKELHAKMDEIDPVILNDNWRFSHLWITATFVGSVTAVATMLLPHASWLLSLPFALGLLCGSVTEFFAGRRAKSESDAHEPSNVVEHEFHSDFWLALQKQKSKNPAQLDLFEQMIEDPSDRRRVHYFQTTSGGSIYIVQCSRYQDLLLSRIVEDVDKATEHALAVALKRHWGAIAKQDQPLFRKTFRETIKGDFRGNLARLISRVGDSLTKELSKEAPDRPEEAGELKLVSQTGRVGGR